MDWASSKLRWGNTRRAAELLERSAQLARDAGAFEALPPTLHGCGDAALIEGNYRRAAERYRESLRPSPDRADCFSVTGCVAGLAATAAMTDDTERAGRLWGGLHTFEQELGWTTLSSDIDLYNTAIAARSQSDPTVFAAAEALGRRMSLDQIVAYALGDGGVAT